MLKKLALVGVAAASLSAGGCMDSILGMIGMGGEPDPAEQYVTNMTNAPMVMYFVNFHNDPAVGQWATYKDFSGETWYGVVGGSDDAWLVEKRAGVPGQDFMIATIMQVDNQGNVSQAWAAPYDAEAEEKPEAVEVLVMDKPEPVEAQQGEAQEGPKPEWSTDTVAGLETEKMSIEVQGKTSETWFSPKAYFSMFLATDTVNEKGGVVKSAYDGNVNIELLEQGEAEVEMSATLPESEG